LPGILAWAVRGCLDWQKDGGGATGLLIPPEIKAATQDYRQEEDVIGRFLQECCVEDPAVKTLSRVLFAKYAWWAQQANERQVSTRAFGMYLRQQGRFTPVKSGGDSFWGGIRLS
jgi:putative DNA primase/helicase